MPTTLGKYTLGRELGTGVSCKVKLAKDDADRRYAIKILKGDASFDELIQTEVEALFLLDHPNIIKIHEVQEGTQIHSKKQPKRVKYIVLELAQGGELFDFVALGGRLEESTARFYFQQLIYTLKYAHSKGVAHRDLKPENLMLDKAFNIKIADFGFAAPTAGRDGSGLLETQLGTHSYMAPEIHAGRPYEGAAVDLFAAAIILFVICTQRPPFASAAKDDPHYKLISSGGEKASWFWDLHAEAEDGKDIYSAEFKDLFGKMMALEPANRLNIDQVIAHPWFNGTITPLDQIQADFKARKAIVDQDAHEKREDKRKEREKINPMKNRGKANDGEEIDSDEDETDPWKGLEIPDYDIHIEKQTRLFTTGKPLTYFLVLVRQLEEDKTEYKISKTKLQLKFDTEFKPLAEDDDEEEEKKDEEADTEESQKVQCIVRIFKCSDGKNVEKHCIDFTYLDPVTKKDMTRDERAPHHFKKYREMDMLKNFFDTIYEQ